MIEFDKNATLKSIDGAKKKVKALSDEITLLQSKGKTKGLQKKADEIENILIRIAKEEKQLAKVHAEFPIVNLGKLINSEGVEATFDSLIAAIGTFGSDSAASLTPPFTALTNLFHTLMIYLFTVNNLRRHLRKQRHYQIMLLPLLPHFLLLIEKRARQTPYNNLRLLHW